MHQEPSQPGQKSREMNAPNLHDSAVPANGGHLTTIHKLEVGSRRAILVGPNGGCHIRSLLHGDGRRTRQRRRFFAPGPRKVSGHEHIRVTRDSQLIVNNEPACAVSGQIRVKPKTYALHSGSPDDRCRAQSLLAKGNTVLVNAGNHAVRPHLNSEALQIARCPSGMLFSERR